MSTVHQTEIEFFGGPCDGYRQAIRGPVDELKLITAIPLPFTPHRCWLKRAWASQTKSNAIYSFDCGFGRIGYYYLGTIRRQKLNWRSGSPRWLRWLRGAFERRFQIIDKSSFAS